MFQKESFTKDEARSTQEIEQDCRQEMQELEELEERLGAYYGPALPEYPLPATAWLSLRARLNTSDRASRRYGRIRGRIRGDARQPVPREIQQIYAALLSRINYRHPAPALHWRLTARGSQPRMSVGVLGRGSVKLTLPRVDWRELPRNELEILLMTGLARCASATRRLVLLLRLVCAISVLVMLAVLPFTSVDRRALWIFAGASACGAISGGMLIWQQRVLAYRGDLLAVQWLGRSRVCQGLHALARHSQPPRRLAWGEPSLRARIARVCGTSISSKEKNLTLVG